MAWLVNNVQAGLEGGDSVFRKGVFDSAALKVQYDFEDYEHVYGQS